MHETQFTSFLCVMAPLDDGRRVENWGLTPGLHLLVMGNYIHCLPIVKTIRASSSGVMSIGGIMFLGGRPAFFLGFAHTMI